MNSVAGPPGAQPFSSGIIILKGPSVTIWLRQGGLALGASIEELFLFDDKEEKKE